jgi:alpha-ketoglutarate-dependent taurine dioxygenase
MNRYKIASLKDIRPQVVNLSSDPVAFDTAFQAPGYPVLATPNLGDINTPRWLKQQKHQLDDYLLRYGALLLRGFNVRKQEDFYEVLQHLGEEMLTYTVRSSPRHQVHDKIYTSTDYPAQYMINMHSENSYAPEWPLKILFYCDQEPGQGGETPIADNRRVAEALGPATLEKFRRKGVRYVRNFGSGLGLSWQEVFQTDDPGQVEAYCRRHNMAFNWKTSELLTIQYSYPAFRAHPVSGESLWFNHAFFFNVLSLDAELRHQLLRAGKPDALPYQTYYGDGTDIEQEVIEELRHAYATCSVRFGWQKGDVLILDNMLMSHGRMPFVGGRRILVGMLQPYSGR